MGKLTGRSGAVAKAIIAHKESRYPHVEEKKNKLIDELKSGSPETLKEAYDNGPKQMFEAIHGNEIATLVGKTVSRLSQYIYSSSLYRRSFRTQNIEPYFDKLIDILETIYFPWTQFDIVKDLLTLKKEDDDDDDGITLGDDLYGDFLATYIDDNNQPIIKAIEDICLGDNNTKLLTDSIINGIVKSRNTKLYRLLGDMLLAAKLQEGLRQSILENADSGQIDALIYLMKIVLENDLLRYSSAIRAVGVWMGMDEYFDDKRVVTKLFQLGYHYLTDEKARTTAAKSKDVIEIYASLWANSVYETEKVLPLIDTLMAGEKYQQLAALYFISQSENEQMEFSIASKYLEQTDLDVLNLVMEIYPINYIWSYTKKDFIQHCREKKEFFQDETLRNRHFNQLLKIVRLIPQNGYKTEGKPFDWCNLTLNRSDVFTKLLTIAGYDFDPEKTELLIDNMQYCDSDNRAAFIKCFLDQPKDGKEREFLFNSLNDKSMPVRSQALENIKTLTVNEEEAKLVINLLALKTGDLRQNAVDILLTLPGERPVEAAKTLLADKQENKRLAGLDILSQLVKKGTLKKKQAVSLLACMPKVTDKEQILIDGLVSEGTKYNKENGFGMYDPEYRPELPPLETDKKHTLKTIFDFSSDRMNKLFDDLSNRIKQNKDYTYQTKSWDDSLEDVVLGANTWIRPRADAQRSGDDDDNTLFDNFVLQDVWRGWLKDNNVTFNELFLFMFIDEVADYDDSYDLDYQKWANKLIEQHFNAKEINKLIKYWGKKEYSDLARNIIGILWTEFPEQERFEALYGALADLMEHVPEVDWQKPIEDEEDGYYRSNDRTETFADTKEVEFLTDHLSKAAREDEHFKNFLAVCYELGRLSDMTYIGLSEEDIARGVTMGVLKIDSLYKTMFLCDCVGSYAGKIQYTSYKKAAEKYPVLKEVADKVAARVIEIELKRGDSKTEVSKLACDIRYHEGADTFAKILVALGKETFVRGYIYSSDTTKKAVLSSLLKNCHPKATDNAKTLKAALDGKIDDKRLIEAAMYSPGWLNIVGDYLGWPGLQSAAWYFHAHINQSFSAEKETEVARYSPISAQDFNDGAFDIAWFKEAYQTLGAERFGLLYDCAKYLTEGGNHRRAQLFADATLGKLELKELKKEIKEKRNKDKLLSYSLVPLNAKKKQEEALERYEFIQEFLKESKTFGAQRKESEGKASAIALENLARNAGFSDSLRFGWCMETLKMQQLTKYFIPEPREDISVHISINKEGIAELVCEKEGKKLSSVPAKLKKDTYITECKEVVSALKNQFKRAKASLEQSMVNRDAFEFRELKQLVEHPVIAPLLQKLLFVSGKRSGAFCELLDLPDSASVNIAHPYDLYTASVWLECQHYAFEHQLVQPFKQIFRELYLINEDERAEKTISRRYAGHQVQPQKTVALLKGRGWTVDYEEGLQRVYYKENIIATMYAAADWFSPSDIEAPTLETVQFFDRKTHKPLPFENIPPVIFSEVMRDIDLVISVAHIGGVDPEASHSTIEMRAVIVSELLALLHIENVLVKDRQATVKGSLGEYTVHLGSGVVHKMGKGAVNILAVQSQHRGRIFLPFADEDPRTAEVISKIILLADDKSIKDPAILNQIK